MRQEQQPSLMMRLWHALLTFINALLTLIRQDYQAIEFLLISLMGAWAIALLLAPDLFQMSHTYDNMAALASQTRWGLQAVVNIVLWIAAIRLKNATVRVFAHLSMIGWYSFLMLLFGSVNPLSFGALSHAVFFAFSVWLLWRFAGRKRDREP